MKKSALSFLLMFVWSFTFGENVKSFNELVNKIEKISFSQGTQAKVLIDSLYQIAGSSPDSSAMLHQLLYTESIINRNQGINDPTLQPRIERVLKQTDPNNNPGNYALLSFVSALNYNLSGDYGQAFSTALQALAQYRKIKDEDFIKKTLTLLGNICSNIKNYNLAENYYEEAYQFVKKPQPEYYQLYINMKSRLLYYTQQYQEAAESLMAIIPELQDMNETELLSIAYLNLGAAYMGMEQYDQAFVCYDKLLAIAKKIDNKKLTISCYQNLGVYYYKKDDFKKAHAFFLETKRMADATNNPEQRSAALYNLSFTFDKLNHYDSAYVYLQQYNTLSNKLFNNAKTIEAYQSYVDVVLDASQNSLTIAEQKLELRKKQIVIIITVALAIIILAFLLFILAQQKKRIKEAENKDLTKRLVQESQIMQLQDEKLQTQVREITSYSMMLAAKNNTLQQISKLVGNLRSDQPELAEIKTIIQHNLYADSDWKTFILHFEKVHPNYFTKLKERSSELTKNDLRFCAYLRMGIDSKEIAKILNVSPGSIRMHRYRVKKKFGLAEEDNLDDFIRSI